MPDYKSMYFALAAEAAEAAERLLAALQRGEDSYVESASPPVKLEGDRAETE